MLVASSAAVTHRNLETLDLVIIGIYFAIVFGIGFYFSRKERTSEDYFLASRNIGWFAIGGSLFVSNISTEHFIGLAGSGATSGLAVGHFEWLACWITCGHREDCTRQLWPAPLVRSQISFRPRSFARFHPLVQAQKLHALRHDRRQCFLTGCKHYGLVQPAVRKQGG